MIYFLAGIFGIFFAFFAVFRNGPKVVKFFKSGIWILREFGFGIYYGLLKMWKIIKIGFVVLKEIWKIGIEIYHCPKNVWKILKNGFKLILAILNPKVKRNKNRKFIKNRSRRAENRSFKKLENKMDYLKQTDIVNLDENVENVGSGDFEGKK